ncbi:hypothetical protein OIE62_08385 [Streptomyces scopuliridis]|uniref:Uncharacterized protein n=1 Tax=Streptomyces scopuliridis TaxID=452529 RepID=A0ACD4ZUG7_9ACTN|nr:hypothetical protein [Streptomyces scopuliridis]WSC01423.1 hypothetical protein OG835_33435 [Streptomyces scopuliridis]WSC05040.1 hypothetical protein OIE62_08385 [Streptomyces scopuliridis]
MFRYAFPAAPSAVADAPKAAGFLAGLSLAYAACAAAFTATAPPAAAVAAAPAAPLGGARS